MNAFYQLEKQANWQTAPGVTAARREAGMPLRNPYAVREPAVGAPNWKKELGLLGADVVLGSIPVVGGLWGAGRAVWDAAHGDWGGAATNAAMAGLGVLGLGGAGAAAKAGIKGVGLAGRIGGKIAQTGARAGMAGGAARGLMRAGAATSKLPGMGRTLHQGVSVGGRQLVRPITTGSVAHAGLTVAAPQAVGAMLPGPPQPAPQPAPSRYTGSVADVMANEMTGGGYRPQYQ